MSEELQKSIRMGVTTFVTPILIVALGYFINRLIVRVDDMNSKMSQSLIEIRAMQENVKDHESRINKLENWRDNNLKHQKSE